MRSPLLLILAALALAIAAVPASAADAVGDGAAAPAPGDVIELSAPTPDWYTPELHARVLAAGPEGVPLPEDADVPASALAFTGIRPGAWMMFPSWCTMNFVFGGGGGDATKTRGRKASTGGGGGLYIGTAGHCTEVGDTVTLVMAPGVLVDIGRTVKSVDDGIGNDFALIEIDPALHDQVSASMAILAGPSAQGAPAVGQPIVHVGHGLAVGTGGTPRAGVVTYTGDGDGTAPTAYGWDGVGNLGDSGSGVRAATGEAVGNLTHLVVGTEYLPAYIAGTTAERMEQIAGQEILCASLVPNPLPEPPVPC